MINGLSLFPAIPANSAATLAFIGVLGWFSAIDWHTRRLPDMIVLPTLWINLILDALTDSFASPRTRSSDVLPVTRRYGRSQQHIAASVAASRSAVAI